MTYQEFCDSIKELKKQEAEYNEWRKKAIQTLLTEIGPKLSKCHDYTDLKHFGNLLTYLALPVDFTAAQCEKIQDQISEMVINKVLFDELKEKFNRES